MDKKLIDQFQMFRFVSLQDIESLGETFDFHGLTPILTQNPHRLNQAYKIFNMIRINLSGKINCVFQVRRFFLFLQKFVNIIFPISICKCLSCFASQTKYDFGFYNFITVLRCHHQVLMFDPFRITI